MPTEDDNFDDDDTGDPEGDEPTNPPSADEGQPAPPIPKTEAQKAAARRLRGKPGAGTPRLNAEGLPNVRFNFKDAELLWGEILVWLRQHGKTAYDVTIQVVRSEPPPAVVLSPNFDGSSVVGDSTTAPSDALIKWITDYYHMPVARQQSTYEVRFLWKINSARIAIGKLTLPSPQEIMGLRNNAMRMQGQAPQPVGQGYQQPPPQGFGQPPQPQWPQPQQGERWPSGFAQAPTMDAGLAGELGYLRGALSEALAAAREGRQPNLQPPPPGVAAPSPPPFNEDALVDKVATKVAMILGRVMQPGVAAGVAAPPAPPPAPNPANSLTGMVEKMVMGIMETSLKTVMGSVEKQVKAVGTGMGAPPEEPEEEVAEPTPPEDPVPWHVAPVSDVKWPDGTPVRYAADKETKDISPMGLAFSNPYVAEKVMGMANGVAEAIKKVVTDAAQGAMGRQPGAVGAGLPPAPQQAQVVESIPHDAVNGQPPAERGGWPSV